MTRHSETAGRPVNDSHRTETRAGAEPAACCSSETQEQCCGPADKETCCGTAGGGCAC